MGHHLVDRRRVTRPQLHERGHLLAPPSVRRAHHDGVEHRRVLLQRRLDLLRIDLLAARVDAHRSAAEQRDHPVVLDHGEVTGHHPPLAVVGGEGGRGLLRVLVVPERDVATARQFPDLARGALSSVVGQHRGVGSGLEARRGERRTVVGSGSGCSGLGRTETVEDRHVRQHRPDLLTHARRQRGSAVADREQHRQVELGTRIRHQRLGQRARHRVTDGGERVHLGVGAQLPDLQWVETLLGVEHQTTARRVGVAHDPLATAVHHRADRHESSAEGRRRGLLPQLLDAFDRTIGPRRVHGREDHVLVPPHDSLGHSRRAPGVEDVGVIAGAPGEVTIR